MTFVKRRGHGAARRAPGTVPTTALANGVDVRPPQSKVGAVRLTLQPPSRPPDAPSPLSPPPHPARPVSRPRPLRPHPRRRRPRGRPGDDLHPHPAGPAPRHPASARLGQPRQPGGFRARPARRLRRGDAARLRRAVPDRGPRLQGPLGRFSDAQKTEVPVAPPQLVEKNYQRRTSPRRSTTTSPTRGRRASGGDTAVQRRRRRRASRATRRCSSTTSCKDAPGALRVVDIVTEGSSLTKSYYDQFHRMLTNPDQGYAYVVKKLNDKLANRADATHPARSAGSNQRSGPQNPN